MSPEPTEPSPDHYYLWTFNLLCQAMYKQAAREQMISRVEQMNKERKKQKEVSDG